MASRLLELVDDGARVIFEQLVDVLRPDIAIKLSVCCRTLHQIGKERHLELRRQHIAAKQLCFRVNMSCAAVSGARELLWYGQGLTVSD